jgi:hypothetical protein
VSKRGEGKGGEGGSRKKREGETAAWREKRKERGRRSKEVIFRYVIDMSRLFPPCTYSKKYRNSHLYQLFRPEFVKRYDKPLCSDGYSGFLQGKGGGRAEEGKGRRRERRGHDRRRGRQKEGKGRILARVREKEGGRRKCKNKETNYE